MEEAMSQLERAVPEQLHLGIKLPYFKAAAPDALDDKPDLLSLLMVGG